MVGVAQLVELLVVVQAVGGSSPLAHPPESPANAGFFSFSRRHAYFAVARQGHVKCANRRRSHGWPPGEQDLFDAATWLGQQGLVKWDWIVDESRQLSVYASAATVHAYLMDISLPAATIDPWLPGVATLILTETRGLAGVLARALGEYVCPVAPTGGQNAGFLRPKSLRTSCPGRRSCTSVTSTSPAWTSSATLSARSRTAPAGR
jgi:hypothetical protein